MDNKILIFKVKLPILIICQTFNVKYQTPIQIVIVMKNKSKTH